MEVRGLNLGQLESAATDTGAELYNVRQKRQDGMGHAFVIRPLGELFRKYTPHTGRKVWAVCYHGHAAFMQRVFDINPDATIISAMERFDGVQDFREKACDVGDQNVGSSYQPAYFSTACKCDGALAEARV